MRKFNATRFGRNEPALGKVTAWPGVEGVEQGAVKVRLKHAFRAVLRDGHGERGHDLDEHQRAEEKSVSSATGHGFWFC